MSTVYKSNISSAERWISIIAGSALAVAAYKRSNWLRLAGLGLIGRGASGFCLLNAALGRDTSSTDTREALGGREGVKVDAALTIDRTPEEVYAYWRQFDNLPRFMTHLEEVVDFGRHSHWTAKGPLGVPVSWDAEILRDIPAKLISWRSVGNADVVSAGSVRFSRAGSDRRTVLYVNLQYDPPAGKLGAAIARLLGEDPQRQIEEDLRRFKRVLETSEFSSGARADGPSTSSQHRGQQATH